MKSPLLGGYATYTHARTRAIARCVRLSSDESKLTARQCRATAQLRGYSFHRRKDSFLFSFLSRKRAETEDHGESIRGVASPMLPRISLIGRGTGLVNAVLGS